MTTPWQIRQAARTLNAGGVIAYPTETVFGLGCDPLNHEAVERILKLKQRPIEKGLILVAASLEQLLPFIEVASPALINKLARPAETPTTWVTPTPPETPIWLRGNHDSIAVRISQHPVVTALCNAFNGAIVSTSANPAGAIPAHNALCVRRYFNQQVDYIIAAHTPRNAQPSQIKTLIGEKVLRGS